MADESMDLKAFVTTTLLQIIEGVDEAIKQIEQKGGTGRINPTLEDALHGAPTPVQFDVAVTVTDSKGGGGHAGLRIASIEIGGKGELRSESQAISRIQFSVPVAMPHMPGRRYKPKPNRNIVYPRNAIA
jgi:hypothetical protein